MSSKTQIVVLRVMRDWSAGNPETDRRRHRRFRSDEIAGKLALIENNGRHLSLSRCTLLDISFGGMCVLSRGPLPNSSAQRFLIDFAAPFSEVVLVKARVAWTKFSESGVRIGVEFLESSKGWLGPERG